MEEEKKEETIQEVDSENSNQQVQEDNKSKGQSRDENAYYADLRRKY